MRADAGVHLNCVLKCPANGTRHHRWLWMGWQSASQIVSLTLITSLVLDQMNSNRWLEFSMAACPIWDARWNHQTSRPLSKTVVSSHLVMLVTSWDGPACAKAQRLSINPGRYNSTRQTTMLAEYKVFVIDDWYSSVLWNRQLHLRKTNRRVLTESFLHSNPRCIVRFQHSSRQTPVCGDSSVVRVVARCGVSSLRPN